MAKILVTGGAGYIGSHTIVDLLSNGFEVISVDSFVRSSAAVFEGIKQISGFDVKNYKVNLCDAEATRSLFISEPGITGVIHFAAFKSVGESVSDPLFYYENNIASLVNILRCVQEFHIQAFVFSSSCSVYGNVAQLPVTEQTPLSKPECAYAASKQFGEQIILDFSKITSTDSILLRYFNPVGAHSSGLIGEVPYDKPNNLVPVITQTASGLLPAMHVWGSDYNTRDGSCIRDYIHVMDIAHAHTLALRYLLEKRNESNYEIFNVGSGDGVTVLEVIQMFEHVSRTKLNYSLGPRRAGDVEAIYTDNRLIAEKLGWNAQFSLEEMMHSAWIWQQNLNQRLGYN